MSMLFRWLIFGFAALLFNFPLLSTLLTSLKSEGEIVSNPSIIIHSPTLAKNAPNAEMTKEFQRKCKISNRSAISKIFT